MISKRFLTGCSDTFLPFPVLEQQSGGLFVCSFGFFFFSKLVENYIPSINSGGNGDAATEIFTVSTRIRPEMQHSVSSHFTNKTAHWLLSDPFDQNLGWRTGGSRWGTHDFLFLYFICSPESRCHRRRGALGSSQGGAGGGWRVEGRWRAQRGPFWVAAHLLFGNTSNGARLPRLDETAFTAGVGFCLFFFSPFFFHFLFCSTRVYKSYLL